MDNVGVIPKQQEFQEILNRVNLGDDSFDTETFPPGTSGEAGLYKYLAAVLPEASNQK